MPLLAKPKILIGPLQRKFGLEYSLEYFFYRFSVKNFKKTASYDFQNSVDDFSKVHKNSELVVFAPYS